MTAPKGAAARITALEKRIETMQTALDTVVWLHAELAGALREVARRQVLAQLQQMTAAAPQAQPAQSLLSSEQLEQMRQELQRRLQANGALAANNPLAGLAGLGGK